jgi:autotransporter translocation and assembly factor TamB
MRRLLRILGWIGLGLLALTVALPLLVLLVMQLRVTQRFVVDRALAAVNANLHGQLRIDELHWPRWDRIELRGVELRDRSQQPVAAVAALQLDLRLRPLLSGRIELQALNATQPLVVLEPGSEQRGLLSVFPSSSAPTGVPGALSPITIDVDRLCLDQGQVRLVLADRTLALQHVAACARLHVADALHVRLPAISAELLQDGTRLLSFRAARAQSDAEPSARLSGRLRAAGPKPLAFDAHLQLHGIDAQALRRAGVDASFLRAAIAANIHATRRDEQLEARAELAAGHDRLQLTAALDRDQHLQARVRTSRLAPSELTRFQLQPIAFHLSADSDLAGPQTQWFVELHSASYGPLPLPQLQARLTRTPDGAIAFDDVLARYGSASLRARGRHEASGALQLQAQLSAPELSSLPPIEHSNAGVEGSARAQLQLSRDEQGALALSGTARLEHAAFAGQRARSLRTSWLLRAPHSLAEPEVDAQLSGEGLLLADQPLAELNAELHGGPDRYRLKVRAPSEHRLRVDASVARAGAALLGSIRLRARLGSDTLRASASGVRFQPGRALSVHDLRASYLGAALWARGELGLGGAASRARLAVRCSDLRRVEQPLGRDWLTGQLRASARVRGKLSRPRVTLHANYWDGPELAGQRLQGELNADVRLPSRRVSLQLSAAAGDAHAQLSLHSRLARRRQLKAAAMAGRHELSLSLSQVSFEALRQLGPLRRVALLRGSLSTQLDASGSLRDLRASNHWQISLAPAQGSGGVQLEVNADYDAAQLALNAQASDAHGALAQVRAGLKAKLERWLSGVTPDAAQLLEQHAWDATLRMQRRALHELPGSEALLGQSEATAPLTLAAEGHVEHRPGREPDGRLQARLTWAPDASVPAEHGCEARIAPQLTAAATWRAGQLAVTLSGESAGRDVLRVDTEARVQLAHLFEGDQRDIVPTRVTARLKQLRMGELPYLCEHASGAVSGTLSLSHPLAPEARRIDAALHVAGLRWEQQPALSADIDAKLGSSGLSLATTWRPGDGRATIRAHLPVRLCGREPALCVDRDGAVEARAKLQRVNVGALLGFVPGVAGASGAIQGQVQLAGTLDHPRAQGGLQLDDVSFTLPRLGQRVSHIHGQLRLDGRTLYLSDTRIRDLDGVARISGTLEMPSLATWRATVDLYTSNFPVRTGGVLVGYVDANAHAVAQASAKALHVTATIEDMSVLLTGNTGADLQPLAPNPDIVFASELGKEDAEAEAPDKGGLHASLHLVSTGAVWVRRDDFAVEMVPDMMLALSGQGPSIRGDVKVVRGYVSLLGQSFDLQRGRVVFTGGKEIDPQLQLTGKQTTPGGTVVRLEVTGFVHKPELAFFLNDQPATAGEALAALTGSPGGGDSVRSAQAQLTSVAVGMTTGLLSLAARQEFGDWVPMFSIQGGSQTRLRVGFDADRLIPDFLRGFVRGAYVEGVIASAPNQDLQQQQSQRISSATRSVPGGGGVLLELMLPADLVWAGQYGPGNTWSVDLNWRP